MKSKRWRSQHNHQTSPRPSLGARRGLLSLWIAVASTPAVAWEFSETSASAGLNWTHVLQFGHLETRDFWTGGMAAADIDGDGWVDLYLPRGDALPGLLMRNLGDGQFANVTSQWQIQVSNGSNEASYASGAAFADLDGNGYPDLFLPGIRGFGLRAYMNDGTRFIEQTAAWGLAAELEDHLSLAFGDINGDGSLDVAVSHWNNRQPQSNDGHLWLNQNNQLHKVGNAWNVTPPFAAGDYSFTPNIADFNRDYWPDLVYSADFNASQSYLNQGGASFALTTDDAVLTDENGMGSAIGDYDNDGDLDWFVTSIYDPNGSTSWGTTGNRMYRNDGQDNFSDVTDAAGVRDGFWGWGACMEDLNNDGWLDIFHVNGWNPVQSPFQNDPARLFVNQGNGQFSEQAVSLGAGDTGQGRGIACFDYDRDGDIDLFISNNVGAGRLYRNDASSSLNHHWLGLKLRAPSPNIEAIGAQVELVSPSGTQYREMRIPNHFLSTSPAEIFYGLGTQTEITELRIRWPDGMQARYPRVQIDQWLTLQHPSLDRIFDGDFEA